MADFALYDHVIQAGGQGLWNCHRKRMTDSTAQSQLTFVTDGKTYLCGCSVVDYLDREHYMNQSRGTR